MPKQSKQGGNKTKSGKTAPAITVETVQEIAANTKVSKSAKGSKTKVSKTKTAAAATAGVTAAPAVIEATNVIVADGDGTNDQWEPSLGDDFAVALNTLAGLRTQIGQLQTKLRALQKRAEKEIRTANKQKAKRKGGAPRAPSGFVKPTQITEELATFLGKDKGTEMARTEVTREINAYIRQHNLQDPSNGRRILPDAQLRKLLRVPEAEELTYFNLQRYMSPHFIKQNASTVA